VRTGGGANGGVVPPLSEVKYEKDDEVDESSSLTEALEI